MHYNNTYIQHIFILIIFIIFETACLTDLLFRFDMSKPEDYYCHPPMCRALSDIK